MQRSRIGPIRGLNRGLIVALAALSLALVIFLGTLLQIGAVAGDAWAQATNDAASQEATPLASETAVGSEVQSGAGSSVRPPDYTDNIKTGIGGTSSVRPPGNAVNQQGLPSETAAGGEVLRGAGSSVRPPAPAPGNAPNFPGIARQRDAVDPGETPIVDRLQTLGPNSDASLWAEIRQGRHGTVSIPNEKLAVMIQPGDAGRWNEWREAGGPLQTWALWAIGGIVVLLAIFFLIRGRVRIERGRSGVLIKRFSFIERVSHWTLATSFILLTLTGLNLLFGKTIMVQLFAPSEESGGIVVGGEVQHGWELLGPDGYYSSLETFATLTLAGKWLHNNISWAFMLALVLVFVFWVWHNIPGWIDVKWLAKGGGIVGNAHPHARKFNAGQKIVFWATILLGASISLSGLALLFPFELPMFAKTFAIMNSLGAEAVWGSRLPTDLTGIEEQQYAQIWHSVIAIAMIVVIIGHIYIGTIGMEGAFDAMGTGWVDRNWAEEHHDLWVAEKDREASGVSAGRPAAQPAE